MKSVGSFPLSRSRNAALALAMGLAALGSGFIPARASAVGQDLTGVVNGPDSRPVTNASIFIYTAGPRVGAGILCPSCYADCRKSAKSGADGRFKIEALDTNLLFQVLVVAPGDVPTFFNKVDPLKSPLIATLKARAGTNIPPSQIILGRVLNPRKEPLANAVVSVNGTTIGNTTSSRPPQGTDPLAITDEGGEFALSSEGKFDAMNLRVEARGYAHGNFAEVRPGQTRRDFIMTAGATLTGRVTLKGKPLQGVTVGVVGADRGMGSFAGDFLIKTTEDGKFLFVNLPPSREYNVYGLMETLQAYGALPTRSVRLGGDDSQTDAGELTVVPGFRLGGRVKLADDAPIPPHTRVLIGRPEAWDTLMAELPPEGRFDFTNVPAETLTVDTRVKGYRFSDRNVSLDRLNPFQLVGRLEADKTDLTLLLEPGQDLRPDFSAQPQDERPNNLPLCGAEGKRTIPNGLTLSGQVLDAETKEPVPQFRITPGLRRNPSIKGWIEWYRTRAVDGTNGVFSFEISLKEGALVLMAEAEGFLPALSDPLTRGHATTTVQLKKGAGPHGKLLLPDGRPADGVTVWYLVAGDHASLSSEGTISMYQNRERSQEITDPEGEFSFAPKLGEGEIFAASPRGFASGRTSELAARGTLTLQPWARVEGRLVQKGKPVVGEHVDLAWRSGAPFDRPWFYLHGTLTDEDGRFALEHVPPGDREITTRVSVGGGGQGWTTQSQRKLTIKPGEDLDLGAVEKSTPSKPGW